MVWAGALDLLDKNHKWHFYVCERPEYEICLVKTSMLDLVGKDRSLRFV